MINEVSIPLDYSKSVKFESLSISEIQANKIEVTALLRSQDTKWHKIGQNRIQNSFVGEKVNKTAYNVKKKKANFILKFKNKNQHILAINIFKIIFMYKNCKGYLINPEPLVDRLKKTRAR